MSDTSLPYYRTIRVNLPDAGNELVVMTLLDTIVIGSGVVEAGETYRKTLGSDGTETFKLPTPDNTGTLAVRYQVTLPGGKKYAFSLAYGAEVTLDALIAAGVTALPADAITELVGGVSADILTLQAEVGGVSADILTLQADVAVLMAHTSDTIDPHPTASTLSATVSAGATSITLTMPPLWLRAGQYIIIDAYTTQAELRQIATVNLATGAVTFIDTLDYSHAAADLVLTLVAPVVWASWFGAVGDDSTNDTTALTLMVDQLSTVGGGIAYAPETYKVTLPILIRANVTLDLCGSGMIHNTYGSTAGQADCVALGWHHPIHNDNYTQYALGDITAGDVQITFTTPAQAANMVAGQPLMIRSAEFYNEETMQKPRMLELNRARAIDAATGIVTLDYPVGQSITSPKAMYIQNAYLSAGRYSYIADRATFRNGRVKSDNGDWVHRFAALDCTIENIEIIESIDFLIGNSLAHCRVRGLRGVFGDRCLEFKTGAHDTIIENCQAFYDSRLDTGGTALLIDTGEYNRDLTIRGIRIHAPGWNGTDMVTPRGDGAIIEDCEIYAPSATGSAVGLYSQALESSSRNVIQNCRFTAGAGSQYIKIGTVNNGYTATVSGAPTTTITAAGNDFADRQPVRLTTTGTLPAPLAPSTTYWIVNDAGADLQLSATSGGTPITFTDAGTGEHTITRYLSHPADNTIRDCDFIGGASVQSITAGGGTGNLIIGNRFGGTQPGINIQSTQFAQNRIVDNFGLDGITSTTEAEQGGNHFSGNRAQDRYAGAVWFCGGVVTTSSTVADTVIATMTLPAGVVVRAGDIINFVVRGHFVGTGGVKNVRVYNVTEAAFLSSIINYTGAGGFLIRGHYAIRGNPSADRYFSAELPDGTRAISSSAPGALDFLTNGMTVELRAWCAVGTDAVRFTEYRSWVTGPLS